MGPSPSTLDPPPRYHPRTMTSPNIDWDAVTEEATDILSRYIAIDTTNPPGNEERRPPASSRSLLRDEGIDDITFYDASDEHSRGVSTCAPSCQAAAASRSCSSTTPTSSRSSAMAGTRSRSPVWSKDGVIWGRGALDMKGMGVMELMALLLMKRHGIPHQPRHRVLRRRRRGGRQRLRRRVAREAPPGVARRATTSSTRAAGARPRSWASSAPRSTARSARRAPAGCKLVAEGRPGHGSVPHDDNALDRLVRALNRIAGVAAPVPARRRARGVLRARAQGRLHARRADR